MDSENKIIHDFDFSLICEYFSNLERQGPGSVDVTEKALSFVDNLTDQSQIADIGCGTGGQTMTLAKHTLGNIIAIDLFPDFIDILNRNAKEANLQDRIKGIVGSMDSLPFLNEELDLIWSEGAIYNIGFERGLNEWRKYLKRGGYIAVSEISWFTEERSFEINDFWTNAYSEIDTIPNQIAKIQKAGYQSVASFILPENCWTKNYFRPQIKVQDHFLRKYKGNKDVEDFIKNERRERELYHKYKEFYGYTFFIAKKIEL